MNSVTIILISSGIFVAIFAIFLFGKKEEPKKGEQTTATVPNVKSTTTSTATNANTAYLTGKKVSKKDEKGIIKKDIFDFMEFEKIADNMIIQDKGNRFTMVVQCKGINYDLMSEIEQLAVEEGFITFLNTLKFPVQLYVQARAVDLKSSMDIYKRNVGILQEQYKNSNDNYNRMANDINANYSDIKQAKMEKERNAHILDYAQDITRYVERISLNKHILQRKFYILLSYNRSDVTTTGDFTKEEIYDICYRELATRAQSLVGALTTCSVQGKVLSSNEIAELLYISYNRDDEKLMDIRTALESGFYRLYSTSKDAFEKQEELRQKQIEEAAYDRVKDALMQNMRMKNGLSERELLEEFEERADREAMNMINTADLSDEERQELTDIIASRHVIEAEKRKQADKVMKEAKDNAKDKKSKVKDGPVIADTDDDFEKAVANSKAEYDEEEIVVPVKENTSSVDGLDDSIV